MPEFPSVRMRLFLLFWAILWATCLPAILVYLRLRAKKDRTYGEDLGQRFGLHAQRWNNSVWVHAVSLGEFRSSVPLIRRLLQDGERVVVTHFTPVARREIARCFAQEISQERLIGVWIPLEFHWCYRRFFRAFRPKFGLVMEVEFWPRMIASSRLCSVPLFLCNGQYPSRSYERDRSRLRGQLVKGFAGLMVKDLDQRNKFLCLGVSPDAIQVTGEMRFDQPIPDQLLEAALALRSAWPGDRPCVTIASAVEGEDETYIQTIRALRQKAVDAERIIPCFVYVPRAPERFDLVYRVLAAEGWNVARRSEVLDENLKPLRDLGEIDVLLGDSMGEMYFYLSLSQKCVVGGGFTPKGAHNIIEPLALEKPVYVGPEIWTIEYPAIEAHRAGVLTICADANALANVLDANAATVSKNDLNAFFIEHSGGVDKTIAALPLLLDWARVKG